MWHNQPVAGAPLNPGHSSVRGGSGSRARSMRPTASCGRRRNASRRSGQGSTGSSTRTGNLSPSMDVTGVDGREHRGHLEVRADLEERPRAPGAAGVQLRRNGADVITTLGRVVKDGRPALEVHDLEHGTFPFFIGPVGDGSRNLGRTPHPETGSRAGGRFPVARVPVDQGAPFGLPPPRSVREAGSYFDRPRRP